MIDDFLDSPLALLTTHFAMLSLAAVGGGIIVVAPDMQRYVVEHGWMTAQEFAIAFTIAQASPGPNFLFVLLVGGHVAGVPGAISTTLATIVPPALLTFVVLRASEAHHAPRLADAMRNGLAPMSAGLMLATGWILLRSADADWRAGLLTAITLFVVVATRTNPLWLIAAGASAGIVGLV